MSNFDMDKALEEFMDFVEHNDIKENADKLIFEYLKHKDDDLGELIKFELDNAKIDINEAVTEPNKPLNFGIEEIIDDKPIEAKKYYTDKPLNSIFDLFNVLGEKLGFVYSENIDAYWLIYATLLDIFEFDESYIDRFYDFLSANNCNAYQPPFKHLMGSVFHLLDIVLIRQYLESELKNLHGK